MIGKIAAKGRSFRGLSAYLLRRGSARIVAGVMAGRTARELASEFGVLRRLNPKLTKAVAHLMLSPAPDDPPLADEQWQAIAQHYIGAMGFGNAPWIAVVHQDTDHQHMHLMACRIGFDGKTISDANDFRKSEAVVRHIEAQFGLAAVPSPEGFKPKSRRREATIQGEKIMTDSATPPSPLNPGNPASLQHATWPQPSEPGREQAEPVIANTSPDIVMPGASAADPLTKNEAQAMRRAIVEDDYQARMHTLLGDDLTRVHVHAHGATLYFKQRGRIADQGSKLTVLGGMDQRLAAQRVVALGIDRGWKSITFTGSGSFVELAMREAISHRLAVVASDERQKIILAKIMAERRGGRGAVALPVGAVPADGDIPAILAELDGLDDLPAQPGPVLPQPAQLTAPVDRPPAAPVNPDPPKPPQVGVLPKFLNLSERLHDRRSQKPSHAPGTIAAPAKRPSGPAP